tara:strand:- start:2327 stop:2644 length:318 start_codon:yes stop_codon:yes gene_type:complete
LPSEKEVTNIGLPKTLDEIISRQNKIKRVKKIADAYTISHGIETDAAIPMVILPKYIDNSNGDFTGFLNLTIDKAPTIPSDNAILPDITLVITKVIIGNSVRVAV